VTDSVSTSAIASAETAGQFSALGKMALFPLFGLVCYLGLMFHFKSKGGYKPVQLGKTSAGGKNILECRN
jgi:hypothetical protein